MEYYYKNWDIKQKQRAKWIKNNPEKIKKAKQKYYKKWVLKNEDKHIAHYAIHNALRRKEIEKPKRCSECNKKSNMLNAHHYKGYNKINLLTILWLCPMCHRKKHYVNSNFRMVRPQ